MEGKFTAAEATVNVTVTAKPVTPDPVDDLATEIKDTFMRALKNLLLTTDEIDLRKVFPKAVTPTVDLLVEKYRMTGAKRG